MSGFNPQQQRMRMMYSNQQQQQQQQYGQMNRMPNMGGGQNMGQMGPNQGMPIPNQGGQPMPGMRPMGNMNIRPQGMSPQSQMMPQQQQQQQQMMMQQQQQQPMHVQQQQQQPQPSPQQNNLNNQSQQPPTPMSQGETHSSSTPQSPSVAPSTPNSQEPPQQSQGQQSQQTLPLNNSQQQAGPTNKEINTVMVCRIGQETIQEIVSRTCEVFGYLRQLQPPLGYQNPQHPLSDKELAIKKERLQDVLSGISQHFKRLRVCWDKAIDQTSGMEYTQLESLIPLKDEREMKNEIEKKRGEAYRLALEEHNELIQQLAQKNRHIKEIIDQMRNIIWEINTMLAMR